jgi:uncharacterized membrane-anchored protein YitT (DUF2179 family)
MDKLSVVGCIKKYMIITIGAVVYSVGIALFLNPNNIAPGGVSGIAIILKKVFPYMPGVGMLIFIINVPILIIGAKKFGIKFIVSTFYTLILSSILIDIIPNVFNTEALTDDTMLAAIIGGATFGYAMGVMFRLETTTGGMDIIVKIVRQKRPYMKTGEIYMLLDVAILIASAIAFDNIEVALFAAIAIFVSAVAMDKTIYGRDEATLVYIVSAKRKTIAEQMLKKLGIGVTYLQGIGAYRNAGTEIIMCVMRKRVLIEVRKLLEEVDPDAFMIVTSANEVFGEGFKSIFKQDI